MAQTLSIPLSFGDDRAAVASIETGDGASLAIMLPGLRYGCDRPVLSHSAGVFRSLGCDIAQLDLLYVDDAAFFEADEAAQLSQIASDGCDILGHLTGRAPYEHVWIIGKSLGTLWMGAAFSGGGCPTDRTHAVWLTPSLLGTPLHGQMMSQDVPSLAVLGTEDPSNRPELVDPIRSKNTIDLCMLEGADHVFAHADGPEASRAVIAVAETAVEDWITQRSADL